MASPSPVPPPRDRSRLRDALGGPWPRAIALWAALSLGFLALYRVTVPAAPGAAPAWPLGADLLRRLPPWGFGVAVGAAVLLAAAWRLRARALLRRATLALQGRDDRAAAALFEQASRRLSGQARVSAWLGAGLARLRLCELTPALWWLSAVERSHGPVPAARRQPVASALALVLAYHGDLEAAEGWAAQARARAAGSAAPPDPLHLAAEAVIAARRGEPAEAVRLLEAAWPELERSAPAAVLAPLRVVRAFLRGEPPGAAVATLAAEHHAWLAGCWPELGAWLRHLPEPAAPSPAA